MGFGSYDESEQENQSGDTDIDEDETLNVHEHEHEGSVTTEGDASNAELVSRLAEMRDSDEE